MRAIILAIMVAMTTSIALADETDDAHRLAISGRPTGAAFMNARRSSRVDQLKTSCGMH